MKRVISYKRVIDLCSKWFTNNWRGLFTEKPEAYTIGIDKDENIIIYAQFNDGAKDYIGLGNMYKWLWENNIKE